MSPPRRSGSWPIDDPTDAHARFNQGICLAWLGRNAEAVAALDLAVQAMADRPSPTWPSTPGLLAEVLRQGGGAETLADDLSHVVT